MKAECTQTATTVKASSPATEATTAATTAPPTKKTPIRLLSLEDKRAAYRKYRENFIKNHGDWRELNAKYQRNHKQKKCEELTQCKAELEALRNQLKDIARLAVTPPLPFSAH